jgi:hypothetical protein
VLPLKVVNCIGDGCEAIYAAQFCINAFATEAIAH